MFRACLCVVGGYGPCCGVQVDLIPSCAPDFPRPRRREYQELQRIPCANPSIGGSDGCQGGADRGMGEGFLMLCLVATVCLESR